LGLTNQPNSKLSAPARIKRAPKRPLVILPHTETELTAPAYGHEVVRLIVLV
jgi:hypothetical protein